jgi:hypothetical protein
MNKNEVFIFCIVMLCIGISLMGFTTGRTVVPSGDGVGGGGGLGSGNISMVGHNHTQDLNTTSNVVFNSINVTYVDKTEIAEPATPSANTLRLFVMDEDGFSRYYYKDEHGTVRTFNDDEIIVKNVRGSVIAAHRIVYVTGNDGGIPTVDLANASSIDTMPSIGVTIESIANNGFGRVMQVGQLTNVNTNSFNVGTIYVSDITAGIPTNTPPVTPSLTQEIGTILVKDAVVGKIQIISRALTGDEFGTVNNFTIIENCSANFITANSFFGDGGNLTNLSIATTYQPVSIFTQSGTLDAGNLGSVLVPQDDDSYNVSEDIGAYPVLTILVNFTGLTSFDSIIGRLYYEGGQGHEVNLEIYRNETTTWENYIEFTDTSGFINFFVPVFDPLNHVNNSNLFLRFDHKSGGNPSHDLFIDYIAVVDGFTALTVSDHDSLGGREDKSNHPWAMPTDGSRNFTGNVIANLWVTAQSFFGDGGNLTNITAEGDGYAGDIGHPHNQDLNTTSAVTVATLNTGQGANELYGMDQGVKTSDWPQFTDISIDDAIYHTGDLDTNIVFTNNNIGFLAGGNVGINIDSNGYLESIFVQETDDTSVTVSSSAADSDAFINLTNDVQTWRMRINGASADRWQLFDVGTGKYPINVDASSTQNNQIFLDNNGFTDFAGAGPAYRIELPNTNNPGGKGRAFGWPVYSDRRFKEDFSKLPKEETLLLCRIINWRIYKPIDNWQDENNIIHTGAVLNDFNVGAYAQGLYWDIVNSFGNNSRAYKIASQIVYVPDDEDTDYWGVDFDTVMKIYARGWQINDERLTALEEVVFG